MATVLRSTVLMWLIPMAGSTVSIGMTPAMIFVAGTTASTAASFARSDRMAMTPLNALPRKAI